jgi:hypothetical protein
MNTKEIVETIENLTGLYFEISINDNQTEVTSTFNPEKINYEYFNVCNELESYFTELYLDGNNLILERILYLLNDGLKLWNRLKKESFNINLNFENKELKNLETELTDAELLRVAEIKTYYIQNLISKIENLTGSPKAKAFPPQTNEKHQPKLSIDEIALKYVYEGLQITRENGNEIAKQYGHTSGEKLFQRFTYYSSRANRKAKPDLCTAIKLKNKIKKIENVIELLPIDKQRQALDEVLILNGIYEAEYQ